MSNHISDFLFILKQFGTRIRNVLSHV